VVDGPSQSSDAMDAPSVADGRAAREHAADLAAGEGLGRYVVLESVGSGGMGRVLRAYDPKLQREVALKVVHTIGANADARDRLLREARAMAKLSHPNVVAVYDAEDSHVGVVLVMEYVAGQTLRQWARSGKRGWSETVARFLDAGRGLAAAHQVGMLHRDFKPSNVLVADTGEVKVTDFGLAKLASATGARHWDLSSESEMDAELELSGDSLAGTLTRADTVVGTPLYMAPEQHRREPLSPAVDQYAFCIALWEALVGKPPFSVKTHSALLAHKQRGAPVWPGEVAVPRPIVDALRRGLAPEPAARWPTMRELLVALEHDPARRRNRWLAALGGVGLVGVAGVGWQSWATARAERCTGAREQLAGVWDDARRDQARAAMMGIGAAYADPVWERTAAELDRYTDEWVAMHTDACEATTQRGEQSAEVMDLRMECLRRAKVELGAAVDVLGDADAKVVHKAHELVGGLRPLSRCADVAALRADVEPPLPAEAAAVEEVRARLAEARAELKAGRYPQAQQRVEAAKERMAEVEYGPVHTELAVLEGTVLERVGRYDASEAALQEALMLASKWHQWESLREAVSQLMYVVGEQQQRMEEALRYRALSEGLAEGDPAHEATHRNNLAIILNDQGKYEEAEAEHRIVLELRERTLGPDHPLIAQTRSNLGLVLKAQGKYAEAEVENRRALELRQRVLGPEHPDVAASRGNLGGILTTLGKHAEAEAEFRSAVALLDEALGPEHPDAVSMRGNLGVILHAQGSYAEAEAEFRRTIARQEEVLGPEHPDIAAFRNNLAVVLRAQGKHEEAEAEYRRTLAVWEKAWGVDHPDIGMARNNLANVLHSQGKHEEAEAEHRRVLVVWEKALGPEHPNVANSRTNLARVLVDRGRFEEAVGLAERAWSRRQQEDIPADERAETAFVLAQALWGASRAGERARARGLARQALELFEGAGPTFAGNAKRVGAWVDAHAR
jgi:tetratricopeptide (TPR) repeat protein/predicted Ser/Thr protein kinase